jgi:hypothetical protein
MRTQDVAPDGWARLDGQSEFVLLILVHRADQPPPLPNPSFMEDKKMKILAQGSRREMLNLERFIVERDPGPLNREREEPSFGTFRDTRRTHPALSVGWITGGITLLNRPWDASISRLSQEIKALRDQSEPNGVNQPFAFRHCWFACSGRGGGRRLRVGI